MRSISFLLNAKKCWTGIQRSYIRSSAELYIDNSAFKTNALKNHPTARTLLEAKRE
jgi:hypothetical protein